MNALALATTTTFPPHIRPFGPLKSRLFILFWTYDTIDFHRLSFEISSSDIFSNGEWLTIDHSLTIEHRQSRPHNNISICLYVISESVLQSPTHLVIQYPSIQAIKQATNQPASQYIRYIQYVQYIQYLQYLRCLQYLQQYLQLAAVRSEATPPKTSLKHQKSYPFSRILCFVLYISFVTLLLSLRHFCKHSASGSS